MSSFKSSAPSIPTNRGDNDNGVSTLLSGFGGDFGGGDGATLPPSSAARSGGGNHFGGVGFGGDGATLPPSSVARSGGGNHFGGIDIGGGDGATLPLSSVARSGGGNHFGGVGFGGDGATLPPSSVARIGGGNHGNHFDGIGILGGGYDEDEDFDGIGIGGNHFDGIGILGGGYDEDEAVMATNMDSDFSSDTANGAVESQVIIPRLPPMKITKYSDWGAELYELFERNLVILNYRDPSGKIEHMENCRIQCVLCRDSEGKSDGILFLRRPFNIKLWEQHASGSKHIELMQRHNMRAGNQPRQPTQRGLLAFNFEKKTTVGVVPTRVVALNAPRDQAPRPTSLSADCCGVFNCMRGKYKTVLPAIKKFASLHGERTYCWGKLASMPALRAVECTGRATTSHKKYGMICEPCLHLRQIKGGTNVRYVVNKWSESIGNCLDRRKRSELTWRDMEDAKQFAHIDDKWLTKDGLVLKEEAKAQISYFNRMTRLNKSLPNKTFKISSTDEAISPDNFLLTAHTGECRSSLRTGLFVHYTLATSNNNCLFHAVFEKNPSLRNSIVYALLKALVYKEITGRGNPEIEPRIKNFYRYLHTIAPKACEAVAANLGGGPSKRWMKVLNARDRPDSIFHSSVDNIVERMEQAVKRRLVRGTAPSAFSLAIDATKVSEVLEISTSYKSILGGAFPHHNISTVDLTVANIQAILSKKSSAPVTVEIASEVKVGIMVFANPPIGTSPFEIIAARPQTNNATSNFTRDLVDASKRVASKYLTSFLNFAVDGVSLEQSDVMTAICRFLAAEDNHLGAVDNKHNIKNDRYQLIGGQQLVSIGKWVCDSDLLRQSGVPKELIRIKDFASDKLVDELCSHKILKQVIDALDEGKASGLSQDGAAILCSLLFMKMHLLAVNARNIPAKHRALYLWTSMVWFTTLSGVHMTSKRNLVSETVANMFLVLRSDISKPRHCTSEPAEHTFGNMRQAQREFSCSDFASLVEKEQRRMNLLFEGDLMPTREAKKGYLATYHDSVQHAKLKSTDLQVGPCDIDITSPKPVSEQQWFHVSKIIYQANAMILSLFKCAGVAETEMSPFCKNFKNTNELLAAYVAYCPRTFSFRTMSGSTEEEEESEDDEIEKDETSNENEQQVASQRIQHLAAELLRFSDDAGHLVVPCNDAIGTVTEIIEQEVEKSTDVIETEIADLISTYSDLLTKCSVENLFDRILSVSAIVQSVQGGKERGSTLRNRKVKSLLARWINSSSETNIDNAEETEESHQDADAIDSGVNMIGRDTIVSSIISRGTIKFEKEYIVIGMYDKYYNKWFMTGENKSWGAAVTKNEKKRYKMAIRMVEDGALDKYDYVCPCGDEYSRKEVFRIVDGNTIIDVKGKYNVRWQ